MWRTIKDKPPTGIPIAVDVNNKTFVAYYCDDGFYFLHYDDVLGVLRKQCLEGVTHWTDLNLPTIT